MIRFITMTNMLNKLITILCNPAYRRALLKYRVAAAVEHDALLGRIGSELRTVVDIGANRGQFALTARRHAPSAYIIAFEPLMEAGEVFRVVFQEDPGVELHHCAVGARQGEALLHISRADDSSSLLPITDLQVGIFPGTEEEGSRQVPVTPLEGALFAEQVQKPALLKIDVQGYELEVLKGGASLLNLFDYILVECSYMELYRGQALADEVIGYLEERGFVLVERSNIRRDKLGQVIQADFFFRRK